MDLCGHAYVHRLYVIAPVHLRVHSPLTEPYGSSIRFIPAAVADHEPQMHPEKVGRNYT